MLLVENKGYKADSENCVVAIVWHYLLLVVPVCRCCDVRALRGGDFRPWKGTDSGIGNNSQVA